MRKNCIKLWDDFGDIKALLHKSIIPYEKSEICFCYVSDFKSAKIIRKSIEEICDILDLDFREKNRLVLIIDELNNNAIEYGSLNWEINKMYFTSNFDNNTVTLDIRVEDTGNWAWNKKAKDMEDLKEQKHKKDHDYNKSIRWRWLFLITDRVVDKLYFEDSSSWGMIVWVKKQIKN